MHSWTKFIGGHSDFVMGCLVMKSEEIYNRIYTAQKLLGNQSNPFDWYLAYRGIKTLDLRVR